MAPQPKSAPNKENRWKPGASATGSRRSMRLRSDSHPEPVPQPVSPIPHPACARKKRSRDSEAEADDLESACHEAKADDSHPAPIPQLAYARKKRLRDSEAEAGNLESACYEAKADDSHPEPVPQPVSPIPQPACARKKRSRDPEAEADDLESTCHKAKADDSHPAPIPQPACARKKRLRDSEAEADNPESVCHKAKANDSHPAPIPQPACPRKERSRDSEAEANDPSVRLIKWLQRLPSEFELSEANLRGFNEEEMDAAANSPASGTKQFFSQRLTPGPSGRTPNTAQSPSSAPRTTTYYRCTHLVSASVFIHTDPPKDIQEAADAIVKAVPSEKRRDQLKAISQVFHDNFTTLVTYPAYEDDYIQPLLNAIIAMGPTGKLSCLQKSNWREELKPKIGQSEKTGQLKIVKLDFIPETEPEIEQSDSSMELDPMIEQSDIVAGSQQQNIDNATARKRHQRSAGQTNIPMAMPSIPEEDCSPIQTPCPDIPMGTEVVSLAPPSVPKGNGSPIKTPRPDISMGIKIIALSSDLTPRKLGATKEFLNRLQNTMMLREPNGPQEPRLISRPTAGGGLVFPFAVVEGKAYSTGKQMFEAENQAAVAGACGLKMQLCLDELVEGVALTCTSSGVPTPLFFSICIEGPILELWVHWTSVDEIGNRGFYMKLLKICHALLPEGLEDFIIAVDNVLHWGTEKFLESVVKRLRAVATAEVAAK
jgi:hypothetical protein